MTKPAASQSTPATQLLVEPTKAAEMLAISRRKLWSETAAGRLQSVRIGRAVRYDIRDLMAYIDAQKSGGAR